MPSRSILALAVGAVLMLAACGSSAASVAPAASTAANGCSQTANAAGAVAVSIKGFAFNPAQIAAKVGQAITFKNDDSAPHTATLVDGSCTTGNIAVAASDGLVFTAAGSYPFHCKIHPSMVGTIVISK